jgi:hypothetical protein
MTVFTPTTKCRVQGTYLYLEHNCFVDKVLPELFYTYDTINS